MTNAQKLRDLLAEPGVHIMPGCFDALSAKLIERAGFGALVAALVISTLPGERSGWLKFGEPRFTVPTATAEYLVQPTPGLLVLFPSYLWHGTNAIHGDDHRVTIAFDALPAGGSRPQAS